MSKFGFRWRDNYDNDYVHKDRFVSHQHARAAAEDFLRSNVGSTVEVVTPASPDPLGR